MYPIMRPMCAFHFHPFYFYFPVQIKLARLIVATDVKLFPIKYESQLVLIIESIALNY